MQHINSKKHKAKIQGVPVKTKQAQKQKYSSEYLRENYNRFILSSSELSSKITGDPGAFCAKCEKQFDTPTNLEEHFLTPEHKNFQPIKRKYFFNQDFANNKKRANQNQLTAGLENYGYGNPTLHVQVSQAERKQTNTFVSSTPTTYNYLVQKQPSAYGYNPAPPPPPPQQPIQAPTPTPGYTYPTYNSHTTFQTTSYQTAGYNAPVVPQQPSYNPYAYSCVPPPPPFPYQ